MFETFGMILARAKKIGSKRGDEKILSLLL